MADFARASRNLQTKPAQAFRDAKNGSIWEIKVIANSIQAMPQLQTPEVIEMLCSHLDASKAPDPRVSAAARSPAAERAFSSLLGLGNFGRLLTPYATSLLAPIKKSWPGIFKWMVFFHEVYSNPNAQGPKNAMEIIAYALYSITHEDAFQDRVTNTPGAIALAASLWMKEDARSETPLLPIPVASSMLHHILFCATDANLDEFVKSAGGKTSTIADLCLSRLRSTIAKPLVSGLQVRSYVDVMVALSRGRKHALRRAILHKGGIGVVTKALLKLSVLSLSDEDVRDAVIACFGFISNLIESGDGIHWVRQAVQEGLLLAFVNISPSFKSLDTEARSFTLALVSNVLPRYLVYRSVIMAVSAAMEKVDTPENRVKIERSPVKDSMYSTKLLADERKKIQFQSDVMKKELAYCDHCQKYAPKDTLKKCGGCQVTLYCSKECQTQGWKKIHRSECKLKDEERIEVLQQDAFSKDDRVFLHNLAIYVARKNLLTLRRLAKRSYADIPLSKLGVRIDFTKVPPTYEVFLLSARDISKEAKPNWTPTLVARSESILEKAINSEGRNSLIESVVSVGEGTTIVVSLTARCLWDDKGDDIPLPGAWLVEESGL
ncbi:hypothetical protein FA95DRAFT_1538803 [Auriscalpium vulgare]|uniref:Uncharacterized protein n=1 Tax=Auriscalpium vulgare TaxID=40419 RepID=A0ACB8S009_9AGAM|nr:hypothetical protein FA95DRAFT_1538803 [Auriscalpium vulgare]